MSQSTAGFAIALFRHFRRRARERYGLSFTAFEWLQLSEDIALGRRYARVLRDDDGGRQVLRIRFGHCLMHVVFDVWHGLLVTALPKPRKGRRLRTW